MHIRTTKTNLSVNKSRVSFAAVYNVIHGSTYTTYINITMNFKLGEILRFTCAMLELAAYERKKKWPCCTHLVLSNRIYITQQ